MPAFGPIRRREFIAALARAGFQGPFTGRGPHPSYMVRGTLKLKLPNPHDDPIRRELLGILLKKAGISREEWEAL